MGGNESVIYSDEEEYYSDEHMEEWDKLKKEGHVCLRLLESDPPYVDWCGKEKCEGRER